MLKEVLKRYLIKGNIILLFLFLLLVIPRFLWLREFPVGINHDEVDVVLSAKTYLKFGTDLSGAPFPKSLVFSKIDAGSAGLPSFLMTPLMALPLDALIESRIIYILLGILTSIFLGLVVWELSKDKQLSIITFLISLVNPWLFFYSRSLTEPPWSLLFSLIGIYLLFKLDKRKILYSLIAFAAAFYSYQAAKLIIMFLVPLLFFIRIKFGRPLTKKVILSYFVVFIIFVGAFFLGARVYSGGLLASRGNEISFLNFSRYEQITNDQRQSTINFSGKYIYFNKYSNFARTVAEKYIGAFSSSVLFLQGDPSVPFSEHGLLYMADLVFIIVGLVRVGKLEKTQKMFYWVLAALFLIAPVSSAISLAGNQYIYRSFLLIPAFIILISLGINWILIWAKRKPWVYCGTIVLILVSYLSFLIFFFYRYPVYQQANHNLAERVLVSYVERLNSKNDSVTVVTDFPYRLFYEYEFFTGYFNTVTKLTDYKSNRYQYQNILVDSDCGVLGIKTIAVKGNVACNFTSKNYLEIQNPEDAGAFYRIYNDRLCDLANLGPWRVSGLVSDYNIEQMSDATFCSRWISKPF